MGTVLPGLTFAFVPSLVFLVVQRDTATATDVALIVTTMLAWSAAWLPWLRPMRPWIASAALVAFVSGVVFLDGGITWSPLASMAFACSVTAICGLSFRQAIPWIAVAVALTYIGSTDPDPHALLISTSLMGGLVTTFVAVTLGMSFLLVFNSWRQGAAAADDANRRLLELRQTEQLARRSEEAALAVDRRIHETVLNTLVSVQGPSAAGLRKQCADDLASLDALPDLAGGEPSLSVSALVEQARGRVSIVSRIVGRVPPVVFRDSRAARIAVDSLTEALRNVERHAGTDARILVACDGDTLIVTIDDDGPGIDTRAAQRFGMRSALVASLGSIGGRARIERRTGGGTRATLVVPLTATAAQDPIVPALDILLRRRSARIAMTGTVLFGILAMPFAVLDYAAPALLLASFVAFAACSLGLALGWYRVRARLPLAALSFATGAIVLVIAGLTELGCATAVAMHWVIFAVAGGASLPILALRTTAARMAALAAVIAASVVVSLTSPPECRLDGLDAAVENAVWLSSIIVLLTFLGRAFERQSATAFAAWQEALELQAARVAATAAAARWRAIDHRTRALLRGIADGDVDPGAPSVRREAALEEAYLRSLLDLGRCPSATLRSQLEALVDDGRRQGVAVTVGVLDDDPSAALASDVVDRLRRGLAASTGPAIRITVSPDAVICIADEASIAAIEGSLDEHGDALSDDRRPVTDDAAIGEEGVAVLARTQPS